MTSATPEHRGQDLSIAPDEIRCQARIEYDDGSSARCSRFGIKQPGGEREEFCISHSDSPHARVSRSKGSKARQVERVMERARLDEVADEIVGRDWRHRRDIQRSREALSRAVVRGDVTVAAAKILRTMIQDASEHLRLSKHEWS